MRAIKPEEFTQSTRSIEQLRRTSRRMGRLHMLTEREQHEIENALSIIAVTLNIQETEQQLTLLRGELQ